MEKSEKTQEQIYTINIPTTLLQTQLGAVWTKQIFIWDKEPRKLTLSCASPSLIFVTLQGTLVPEYVLGSFEQNVTVTSLAQLGCRWPTHGEKVISGGGDHVKRTGSEVEWFVSVNDSCLDAPTAQSPNLTWFSLEAAEREITFRWEFDFLPYSPLWERESIVTFT